MNFAIAMHHAHRMRGAQCGRGLNGDVERLAYAEPIPAHRERSVSPSTYSMPPILQQAVAVSFDFNLQVGEQGPNLSALHG